MPDVQLSETEQVALRRILAAEPVPGRCLPGRELLEPLARLIPCDAVGVVLADPQGCVDALVELPEGHVSRLGDSMCDGPLQLGVIHWTCLPGYAEALRAVGLTDSLGAGFRSGRDGVAQVWLDRWTGRFSERDVRMLSMIAPALQRLVRDAKTPALPVALTIQERRTLMLLAAGFSNPEIAERMTVATCTVRKHLEHAYRKLGVTNRLAAVAALRGGSLAVADELREQRDERFA